MKKPPKWRIYPLLAILVIVATMFGQRLLKNRPNPGLSSSGGSSLSIRIDVEPYLQWDKRWADKKLGGTNALLKNYGCTVCATAMALSSRGFAADPAELNDQLVRVGGFTDSGLLIWKGIEDVTDSEFKVILKDRATYQILDQQLQENNPIIAKVLYQSRIWHWVLITGKEGKDYLMHDPLGNGNYHQPMDQYPEGIFSIRYLAKN